MNRAAVTGAGAAVAKFRVATSEVFKDKDGQRREETEWHRVNLWGKQAETLQQYLVKGKQVYIEGRLQTRKWQDKEGQDRYTTEIRADRVVLLGGGAGRTQTVEREDAGHREAPEADLGGGMPGDDEVPF